MSSDKTKKILFILVGVEHTFVKIMLLLSLTSHILLLLVTGSYPFLYRGLLRKVGMKNKIVTLKCFRRRLKVLLNNNN